MAIQRLHGVVFSEWVRWGEVMSAGAFLVQVAHEVEKVHRFNRWWWRECSIFLRSDHKNAVYPSGLIIRMQQYCVLRNEEL